MYTKILIQCSNINTASPLSSIALNQKINNFEIWGLHSACVSLVGMFEDFKSANQRSTPVVHYTESRHWY
jgi:hypothetical protein